MKAAAMTVLEFARYRRHVSAVEGSGLKKASIGTSSPESALSRFARLKEASLRPAQILRRCESEQPTAPAISRTDIPSRSAQRSKGCVSDMRPDVSIRNNKSQPKIFPAEISLQSNALVRSRMGKKATPIPRDLYLGEWMHFFEVGPVELAKAASCTPSYISNIKGERRADVNVLYLLAISEYLGVTVNDLYREPPSNRQVAQLEPYTPTAQAAILKRIRQKKLG